MSHPENVIPISRGIQENEVESSPSPQLKNEPAETTQTEIGPAQCTRHLQ